MEVAVVEVVIVEVIDIAWVVDPDGAEPAESTNVTTE